jgi:hypothetical protein
MIKDEKRGKILEILFVTQYPDNSINIGRLNAENVRNILLSPDLIKEHIGSKLTASEWNTGSWESNPSVLVDILNNNIQGCGWYCQRSGHGKAVNASDLVKVGYLAQGDHGNEPKKVVVKKKTKSQKK